ncbi:MAG TPA: hypothetical protein PLL75_05655 [Candidatus Omnitrophota bacterium]|nr:hypothetical protein [Candidatus Omnitrophota bacterium]HPS37193.1 hypothetical protein [Candidatus Omnitrophota bacterium]
MKSTKLVLILCALLLISTQVFAHPPSAIKIQFDAKTNTVTAIITHRVSNPATHYIDKVDLGLNGKEVKSLSFKKQDNNRTLTVTAVVPEAKAGDSLSVEAYCNLSGKLEKDIKVK